MHAGDREQRRRVVLGGDQRRRTAADGGRAPRRTGKTAPDLVRGHGTECRQEDPNKRPSPALRFKAPSRGSEEDHDDPRPPPFAHPRRRSCCSLLVPAAARASAPYDRDGFHLQSATTDRPGERRGRGGHDPAQQHPPEAQIRYISRRDHRPAGCRLRPVKTMIDFQPGQASATFRVPIIDHGVPSLAEDDQDRAVRAARRSAWPTLHVGDSHDPRRRPCRSAAIRRNPLALTGTPAARATRSPARTSSSTTNGAQRRPDASAWRRSKPGARERA